MFQVIGRIKTQLAKLDGVERVRVAIYDDRMLVTVFHQEYLTNPFKALKETLPRCQLTQRVTPLGRQCISQFAMKSYPFLQTDVAHLITVFVANHPIRPYPDVVILEGEHDHRFTEDRCPEVLRPTRR
jgi:hypothetical protein